MNLTDGTHVSLRNGMMYHEGKGGPKARAQVWDFRRGVKNKWNDSGYTNECLDDTTRFVVMARPCKMHTQCFLDELKQQGGTDD